MSGLAYLSPNIAWARWSTLQTKTVGCWQINKLVLSLRSVYSNC
jgi:hypothetical protein